MADKQFVPDKLITAGQFPVDTFVGVANFVDALTALAANRGGYAGVAANNPLKTPPAPGQGFGKLFRIQLVPEGGVLRANDNIFFTTFGVGIGFPVAAGATLSYSADAWASLQLIADAAGVKVNFWVWDVRCW